MTAPQSVNDCVDDGQSSPVSSPGRLESPAHGNGLLRRGNPGNKGGPGPTPTRLRKALRKDLARDVRPLLVQAVRGDCIERMRVPLKKILEHALCPQCDGRFELSSDAAQVADLEIDVMASPRMADRLRAGEAIAKYGLGESNQMTVISPDVQGRLQQTLQLVMSKETHEREELMASLESIWR